MSAISIIIPTYNRASLLPRALDSVLSQGYSDYELIVVDDGSTDNTRGLIDNYDHDIIYVRQQNKGPAAARNRGILAARHPFIAFLDSDDWFAPDKLKLQLAAMLDEPEYQISHTDEIWYRRGLLLNQKKRHFKPHGYIYPRCLRLCAVSMSTVMVRRRLFERLGMFNEDLPCCEDYDFWLRASVDHHFLKIDQPLTLKDGGRPDEVSVQFRVGMDRFRIRSIMDLLLAGNLSPKQEDQARHELIRKSRIYGNGCIKHGREEEGCGYLVIADEAESFLSR